MYGFLARAGTASVVLAATGLLSACGRSEERAAGYAAQYEAAMANNDPWHARIAMTEAVKYDDANAAYWLGLAKAQLMMADYGGAYGSLTRSSELDRSNVDTLQMLADLSVMSGNPSRSKELIDQVLLLQPASIAAQSTLGFIGLKNGEYEDALTHANTVLESRPDDSNAMVLKARALTSLLREKEAIAALTTYIQAHPGDRATLDALAGISGRIGDHQGEEEARARLLALAPDNVDLQIDHAAALYALGQRERADEITAPLVASGRAGARLMDIMGLWSRYEKPGWFLPLVRARIPAASPDEKVRFAHVLTLNGAPGEAAALVAPFAQLPVRPGNTGAIAVRARALALTGQRAEALSLLNAVLAFDETNVLALRARADLYLDTGRPLSAIPDAQRLVAEKPQAADDRVRLARAYALAKKPQMAENTYRAAIQDIPASPILFADLRRYLVGAGRADELANLDQQYVDQKRLARTRW